MTAVSLIGIIVLAAAGSLFFKQLAERALVTQTTLQLVVSEVRLQDGLEWRAVSGQPTEPIRHQLELSDARVHTLLQTSTTGGLPRSLALDLKGQQDSYNLLVLRELDLLDAGQIEAAEILDEESVDPAAERVLDSLSDAGVSLRHRSTSLTRWSDAGTVASVVMSLTAMGALQRCQQRARARSEQELTSEARHRSLIAQSADLVLVCDSSGRISYLSPAAERALALSDANDPAPQRRVEQFAHPQDTERLQALLDPKRLDEDTVDLRLGRGEGEYVTYEVSVRDLTRDPTIKGLVLTAHDVTQHRALDKAKGDFVATVSHELRTPLTSIRGYLEMLDEGDFGALQPSQHRATAVIDRNAKRLLGLVDELLALADTDRARPRRSATPVDLSEIVVATAQALDPLTRNAGISMDVSSPDNALMAVGNAEQLERVVVNLMSNAVKFTPTGGSVGVTMTGSVSTVVLRVHDTGIGIPVAEQKELFTRFFRSSFSKENEIQGTGLGLAGLSCHRRGPRRHHRCRIRAGCRHLRHRHPPALHRSLRTTAPAWGSTRPGRCHQCGHPSLESAISSVGREVHKSYTVGYRQRRSGRNDFSPNGGGRG